MILVRHQEKARSFIKDFLIIECASLLLALLSPLAIALPFTPVPIVWAGVLSLVFGVVLGKERGALAVIAYLIQGAMGLPVFALGGCGLLHLLGPKGGYLIGYAVGSYLTGYCYEKMGIRSSLGLFCSLLAGMSAVFVVGVAQLSWYVGLRNAFLLGCLPFVILDICKLLVAHSLLMVFGRRYNKV